MTTSASASFKVTNVDPASDALDTRKLIGTYDELLGNGSAAALARTFRKRGYDFPEPPEQPLAVEACSDPHALVAEPLGYHPLVAAVHQAFAEHRPLVLTPDAIWITIVQGLATHINQNPEKYREFFVAHKDKKTIEVVRNSFVLGSPDNSWEDVFGEFSAKIKDEIGARNHNLIVANFSTTGPVELAASEVALMDAMKSYFEYLVSSMCGIPTVTLEGELADWKRLHGKVMALYKYPDLNWWLDSVAVFSANCVEAYQGNVDLDFWESLYKEHNHSGGPFADGWVLKLFPYTKNWQTKELTDKNPCLAEHGWVTHDNLPGSLSIAPFTWNYFGTKYEYQFLAGTVGVEQNLETLALRPKIGWAVRPVPGAEK